MRKAIFALLCFTTGLLLAACGGAKQVQPEAAYDSEKYLARADKLIVDQEYEEARKVLLEVRNRDSQKRYGAMAQLKLADSYSKEGEPELAIVEYRRFIDLYPDNQHAPYAQYQIAMAYYDQIESPERGSGAARDALKEFRKLKELYPRNPYRDVVDLRMEKARNIIADGEYMIGEFYFKKDAYKATAGRIEWLLKNYPDYKREEEALLLLGKAYLGLDQKDKAKQVFERLQQKYPGSKGAAEAKKLLS